METFNISRTKGTHDLKEAVDTFFLADRVEGKKKTTLEFYHFTVGKFFEWAGNIPLENINTYLLRKYFNTLEQKKLSLTTISNNIRALRTFFSFLCREEFIKINPMVHIHKPRLPKQYPHVLEDHHIHKLLKTPEQNMWEGYRNYVMLLTFLDTGIRLGELIRLNLQDINLGNRSMRIQEGKGNKSRLVFMGKKLTKTIHQWIELRGFKAYEETLFVTKSGERLKK